ncbi:MAG: DUF4153 domain-containing protein [bacterium]
MKLLQKFPSYDFILKSIKDTFLRFPFAIICALIGTIIAVYLIQFERIETAFFQQKILALLILGLPLFIALAIFAERLGWKLIDRIYFQFVGVLLLTACYFTLPEDMFSVEKYIIRFLLLTLGLHFLIAFLPFYKGKSYNGFWQYNKSLFLRFLTASLFSAVMFVGLLIALAAADHLFGIDVKEERYFQLWVIIVGIFHPLVFLGGFPKDFDVLENITDFPKGLKVFTQYILLPLVVLYFVILIIYEGKIIFTWNWPSGWVANLVLWYSVVGILSMLLLYPLRLSDKYKWLNIFSNWFFRALVPLLIMLFISIFKRTSEYGITESRYLVIAMAIGLSIAVLYFIFSKVKDMRIIPIILCFIAFLSSFGPWGAFAVSEKSQKSRLNSLLIKNELLIDNTISKAVGEINFDDKKEISSIISYLVDRHGITSFESMFAEELPKSMDTLSKNSIKTELAKLMGFEFIQEWDYQNENQFYNFRLKDQSIIDISKYDQLIELSDLTNYDNESIILLQHDTCTISLIADSSIIKLHFKNEAESRSINLQKNIMEMAAKGYNHDFSQEFLMFDFPEGNPGSTILIKYMNGYYTKDSIPSINSMGYKLFISNGE